MKPKVEIVLTLLIPFFTIIAIIGSLKNNAPQSKVIALSVTGLIWLIGGFIKLYKYKKDGKIY